MKAMETLQDLIEEAKVRTLWWAICIFGIAYFLSHTSKSMWTNILIAFRMLSALRLLLMKWNSAGTFGQFVNQHICLNCRKSSCHWMIPVSHLYRLHQDGVEKSIRLLLRLL